jgi:hypothetical protein
VTIDDCGFGLGIDDWRSGAASRISNRQSALPIANPQSALPIANPQSAIPIVNRQSDSAIPNRQSVNLQSAIGNRQ